MKHVGGILLYRLPLSLSIITSHLKPSSQVSLESGFIEKPVECEVSQAAGKREGGNMMQFLDSFFKGKNIIPCSSFPFMNSLKTLLLTGIPNRPFGCGYLLPTTVSGVGLQEPGCAVNVG